MSHLLILKQQIVAFDIEFVAPDEQAAETVRWRGHAVFAAGGTRHPRATEQRPRTDPAIAGPAPAADRPRRRHELSDPADAGADAQDAAG